MKKLIPFLILILIWGCSGGDSDYQDYYDYEEPGNKTVVQDTTTKEEPKQESQVKKEADNRVTIAVTEQFRLPSTMIFPCYSAELSNAAVKTDLGHKIILPESNQIRFEEFDPRINITMFNVLKQVEQWSQNKNKDGSTTLTAVFKSEVDDATVTVVVHIEETGSMKYLKIADRYLFPKKPDFSKSGDRVIYYNPPKNPVNSPSLGTIAHKVKAGENLNLIRQKYEKECGCEITNDDILSLPDNKGLREILRRRGGVLYPGDIIYIKTE